MATASASPAALTTTTPITTASVSTPVTPIATLIGQLRSLFCFNNPLMTCVKQPQVLVDALWDLDQVVGLEQVKQQAVEQIQYLLLNQWLQRRPMLHGVFYGGPGVGKTKIAKIFAKIWAAIGVLQTNPVSGFGAGYDSGSGNQPTVDTAALQQRTQ